MDYCGTDDYAATFALLVDSVRARDVKTLFSVAAALLNEADSRRNVLRLIADDIPTDATLQTIAARALIQHYPLPTHLDEALDQLLEVTS